VRLENCDRLASRRAALFRSVAARLPVHMPTGDRSMIQRGTTPSSLCRSNSSAGCEHQVAPNLLLPTSPSRVLRPTLLCARDPCPDCRIHWHGSICKCWLQGPAPHRHGYASRSWPPHGVELTAWLRDDSTSPTGRQAAACDPEAVRFRRRCVRRRASSTPCAAASARVPFGGGAGPCTQQLQIEPCQWMRQVRSMDARTQALGPQTRRRLVGANRFEQPGCSQPCR